MFGALKLVRRTHTLALGASWQLVYCLNIYSMGKMGNYMYTYIAVL